MPIRKRLERIYTIALDIYLSGEAGPRGCFTVMTAASEAVGDPQIRAMVLEGFAELDKAFALVAERAIEARAIHPGGGAQIVERGRGKTILPEQVQRLAKRDLRLIGARPADPSARKRRRIRLRRRFSSFLYHLANNSLTQVILCETV